MGGFFGTVSKASCVTDLFYGTDYNSHLGTKRGGLATYSKEKGFIRSIHNLESTYFRTKFEGELDKFKGNAGIGIISDTDAQPIIINSHLGRFAIITVATPYINTYLMEHTTLYEKIEQQCSEQIKRSVEEKQRSIQNESSPDNQKLSQFGIMLPDSVVNDIFEKTGNMAGEIIEQSGLYDEIAKQIAEFVVEGIAFLIALVAAWTIVHVIARALRIVSRIPVLSGVNRTLGVFAGGIYGLILVWIGFYMIAVTSTSEMGSALVACIYQSRLLKYLYENNVILTLIMNFL